MRRKWTGTEQRDQGNKNGLNKKKKKKKKKKRHQNKQKRWNTKSIIDVEFSI